MKSPGPKASVSSCNLIRPRIGFFSNRLTRNKAVVNSPPPSTSETPLASGTAAGVFWAVARHLPGIYPRFAYLSAPLISGSERNDRETANGGARRLLSVLGNCYSCDKPRFACRSIFETDKDTEVQSFCNYFDINLSVGHKLQYLKFRKGENYYKVFQV